MANLQYRDKLYPLIEKIVIGRLKSCDLPLLDQGSSREHCKVFLDSKGRIWAEDMGSANGTKVNGDKIKVSTQLRDGDVLSCSKSEIIIHFDEEDRSSNQTNREIFNSDALVGQAIAGHRILSSIGSTNIVTVYIAKQLSLDRDVVMKVVHPDFADSESPLATEISKQTKLAARITNHNIAQVHECGTEHNFIWSTMELVDGEMLHDLLDREQQLTPDIALMITEKIADGLADAHKENIVHRALNPRNVMISKDGRIKVVDLILEQFLRIHLEQKGIPTPEDHADYLAPELLRGKKGDAKGDIYSLGCMLFHMLAGRPPYVFESAGQTAHAHINDPVPQIEEFCPDLPTSIRELLSTMLHKNAEWRYANMDEVKEQIRSIRDNMPNEVSQNKARRINRDRDQVQYSPAPRRQSGNGRSHLALFINLILIGVILAGAYYGTLYLQNQKTAENLREHQGENQGDAHTPVTHNNSQSSPSDPDSNPVTPTPKKAPNINTTPKNTDSDTLVTQWDRCHRAINRAISKNEWGRAEYLLKRILPKVQINRDLRAQAHNTLNQVVLDGRSWYQKELNAIQIGDSLQQIRQRFIQLGNIRTKVLSESRADIDSRYQQALTEMQRHLLTAQRSAGQLIRAGKLNELTQLPHSIAAAYKGTNLERRHKNFAFLVAQAKNIQFHDDWQTTRQELSQADTESDRISASAALILSGNADAGTDLLLERALFSDPNLHKYRDTILRTQSQLISFNDISDLQYFTFAIVEADLGDGYLTGSVDELYDFSFIPKLNTMPSKGNWEVSLKFIFPKGISAEAEALLQIGAGDQQPITIRIDQQNITAKIETNESNTETPMSYPSRKATVIRLTYYNGTLTVLGNNKIITQAQLECPTGSQFNMIFSQAEWRLLGLRVFGHQ